MEIITLTKDKYETWNKFCLESNDAWFWHTTDWLNYCVSYGSQTFETKDLSFFVTDDSGILAVCPLLMEKKIDGNDVRYEFTTTGGGGYGIAPAFHNDLLEERQEKIKKTIFQHVDELAKGNGVCRAAFRLFSMSAKNSCYNWLLKYGYFDASLNTQVIDLNSTNEALWSALRKGHKYDVNRGQKYYEIKIFDKQNADKNIFDQYRLLHHKAAGRITRPIETFEMMYQWLLDGKGMLCGASKDGRFIGFAYIFLYKDAAYYGSASDDPDLETDVPISHVIQWKVINWLKEKGYKIYEIGVQQFGPQIHDIPTPKDLTISFFKRGFGGKTVPLYRGIKYYDKEVMKNELENNLKNLIERYPIS